ncbi:MAG: aminopeptidase P family protein [Chloroflexi bacterium]|nr:aminopeptidase P family protein [Chloroflexota bacterium]
MTESDRLLRLRTALSSAQADALLVSQPESRRYLSGYAGRDLPPRDSAGYLLVSDERAYLLTDPRTEADARAQAPDFLVQVYGDAKPMPELLRDLVVAQRIERVAFEARHLPFAMWRELSDALEGVSTLVPTADLTDGLRAVKDQDEIDLLRASIAVNDAAFAHVARHLRAGATEEELAWELEQFYRTHGAEDVSFEPITVGGPNTAIPHARPTERPVRSDEPVLFDMGARVRGYCSDMTRTFCIDSLSAELEHVWNVVLEAQNEAESRVRPGMTGAEADAVARGLIDRAGFGEAFVHGLGHGIGLEVHEPPWLTRRRGHNVLTPGMVFSIEPGIYLPGVGGVRIEDLVLLSEEGAEVLCSSPKKLRLQEVLSDLDR